MFVSMGCAGQSGTGFLLSTFAFCIRGTSVGWSRSHVQLQYKDCDNRWTGIL